MMSSVSLATRNKTREGGGGYAQEEKEGNRSDVAAVVDVPFCSMFDDGCTLLTMTS